MSESIISVKGLTVNHGMTLALDGLDFQAREGEFVAIVGESGAGKSTFLNALAGFIPCRGAVRFPSNIGYVFQTCAIFPWMTVRDNIAFGLARGMSRSERKARVEKMLKRIEMGAYALRYAHELSGGQVQRVALARALAPEPRVLLMDEPYGALDHHTRERMQSWLLSIWNGSNKTVLFVTHYLEEAIYLADRVVVLRDKQFVCDLPIPFKRPRNDDQRFSKDFIEVKHQILDQMKGGATSNVSQVLKVL